jgi:sugar phosphate isomerase/epimerase
MTALRIGTTSYIIPDDILPNAHYLAPQVADIELVLFEVDEGMNNLPDEKTIAELAEISELHQFSYTVHLPLDLQFGAGGDGQHISLQKAKSVIKRTQALNPWAYVVHLYSKEITNPVKWLSESVAALERVADWVGTPEMIAVENLEGTPLEMNFPVFESLPVSACVDIGHLWLDGHDPLPYLKSILDRTRVIHMHGIGSRDHQSLELVPEENLRAVVDYLQAEKYGGVVTLEVFSQDDFLTSKSAIDALGKRV